MPWTPNEDDCTLLLLLTFAPSSQLWQRYCVVVELVSCRSYWVDQAPLKYIERYSWVEDGGRRNLSAMVTVLDESVGNITRTLKANGMWEHTLLIFSTDNGGPTGVNVPPPQNMKFKQASNYPLKMGKGTNWEGGVRGVGFVAGGSGIGLRSPPGILNKALIHVTDWLPTLCEVAKCQIDSATGHFVGSNKPVDGFSAWAAISKNGRTQRTEIIHDTIESNYAPAIRSGDYKLVGPNSNKEERDEQRARGEDVVYTLYNIATDPSETTDLVRLEGYFLFWLSLSLSPSPAPPHTLSASLLHAEWCVRGGGSGICKGDAATAAASGYLASMFFCLSMQLQSSTPSCWPNIFLLLLFSFFLGGMRTYRLRSILTLCRS